LDKQKVFVQYLTEAMVVYDIGANVGFFTLLSSHLVGKSGKVYAFEPFTENLQYLSKHLEINCCDNVEILSFGLSDHSGQAKLDSSQGGFMARICDQGKLPVQVYALDQLIEKGVLAPADFVKIDAEGSEFAVLEGGKNFFRRKKPIMLLTTHSPELHSKCCSLLSDWGYQLRSLWSDKPVHETDEVIAVSGEVFLSA